MQSERALSKLEEVRDLVDGDVEELVDTLATILILKQDVSNPMHGAKVTYYTRPPTTRYQVDAEDAPKPSSDSWNWQWTVVSPRTSGNDEEKYWFREKENPDYPDLLSHRAIVYEPFVADAPDGEYWDPERQEYRRPSDYPMGTVNLIYAAGDREFGTSEYVVDIEHATSVTPANGDPEPAQYTPGWSQ